MLADRQDGVTCDLCHRMVDPVYTPGVSPAEDQAILAAPDSFAGTNFGNGMFVVDPTGARRGPFTDADQRPPGPRLAVPSRGGPLRHLPRRQQPGLRARTRNGNYVPNAFDAPATNFSPHASWPRSSAPTASGSHSAYNTPGGVYAPAVRRQQGRYVSTCQDCHMRDVTGQGLQRSGAPPLPHRPAAARHDRRQHLAARPARRRCYPGEVDAAAMQAGIAARPLHAAERGLRWQRGTRPGPS